MRLVPILVLVASAAAAEAQRPTPPVSGRAAGIAAPPAEAASAVVVPGRGHRTGYSQVIRPCEVPQTVGLTGVRPGIVPPASPTAQLQAPQVARPAMPAPPTFMQPVPNQPTASEQMLGRPLGGGAAPVPQRQRASCYTRDAYGRLVIH